MGGKCKDILMPCIYTSTADIAVKAVQLTDAGVQTVEDVTLVERAVQTVSETKEKLFKLSLHTSPPTHHAMSQL